MSEHLKHFKNICACGRVLMQCKCFDISKPITVLKECVHLQSLASVKPININTLLIANREFTDKYMAKPYLFRCSPAVYEDLMFYFDKDKSRTKSAEFGPMLPHNHFFGVILGCEIIIDQGLSKNEWRFERLIVPKDL